MDCDASGGATGGAPLAPNGAGSNRAGAPPFRGWGTDESRTASRRGGLRAGAAQIDITPAAGVHLSGFVAREQPSVGVHDALLARALVLDDGATRIVWLHADLVGFDRDDALRVRERVAARLGVSPAAVVVSATHTHSGPATVRLRQCGDYEASYVAWLSAQLVELAATAAGDMSAVAAVWGEGLCIVGSDRRGKPTKHVDPRVGVLGFRRTDGTYVAVLANYGLHNVAMGPENRLISADIAGHAARRVASQFTAPQSPTLERVGHPATLGGLAHPVGGTGVSPVMAGGTGESAAPVLVTNGGAGNINPPAVGDDFGLVQQWGDELAAAILAGLATGVVLPEPTLHVATETVAVPYKRVTAADVQELAARHRGHTAGHDDPTSLRCRAVFDRWEREMLARVADPQTVWSEPMDVQLVTLRAGATPASGHPDMPALRAGMAPDAAAARRGATTLTPRQSPTPEGAGHPIEEVGHPLNESLAVSFACFGAEMFTSTGDDLRQRLGHPAYVVSYANGVFGYLPPAWAVAEGGYEVDGAHLFYGRPQLDGGAYGVALEAAVRLASRL